MRSTAAATAASHKPDAYHFLDYAEDVCRVIDALDLRDVYGIGHSAGATDLLLDDETSGPDASHACS